MAKAGTSCSLAEGCVSIEMFTLLEILRQTVTKALNGIQWKVAQLLLLKNMFHF